MAKTPKKGSRMAQERLDKANASVNKARNSARRSETDKATGARVYPLKTLKDIRSRQSSADKALDAYRGGPITTGRSRGVKKK